jgi:hypothetical protein
VTRLLREQRASALVTAIVVSTMMMGLGLATYAYVDTRTSQSAQERARESSFNQGEAVLDSQTFLLSRFWPGSAETAYPDCTFSGGTLTATNGNTTPCVDPADISQTFNTQDYLTTPVASWNTKVRDNAGTSQCDGVTASNCSYFYDEATTSTQPRWDANNDNAVWVRAETSVRGKRRILASLVRIENEPVIFPRSVLTSGWFRAQGGPKPYVTQNGSTLALRCAPITDSSCYSTSQVGQVQGPGNVVGGHQPYEDSSHVLPPSDLAKLRARAQADGTYSTAGSCPSNFEGDVIFVEDANCIINANLVLNQPPKSPGVIVFARGTLKVNGDFTMWGVIWMYNGQGATNDQIFDVRGSAIINGAVYIDGRGGFTLGGNSRISYDPNAVGTISGYGVTALVKSSFRELKP